MIATAIATVTLPSRLIYSSGSWNNSEGGGRPQLTIVRWQSTAEGGLVMFLVRERSDIKTTDQL